LENLKAKVLKEKRNLAFDGWIVIPVVVGSSPISHPKNSKTRERKFRGFFHLRPTCQGYT
jgi:hypothetical protein